MNTTLCISTDTTFDEELFQNEAATTENIYATEPIPAIKKPVYHQPDEEELHTSFEEAISGRLLALHNRLSRLSNPDLDVQHAERNTDAVVSSSISTRNTTAAHQAAQIMPAQESVKAVSRLAASWRRATLFACSATIFMLLGFDLMGLLMLHVH